MQKNIVETIGNTPLIEISEISPNSAKIFAKLESSNPAGSIKAVSYTHLTLPTNREV